jgi:hypothetical protein
MKPYLRGGRVVVAGAVALLAVVLLGHPVIAGAEGAVGHAQILLGLLGLRLAHEPLRMDVNLATVAQLSDVPGIRRRQALRIIAHRPYATLRELVRAGLSPRAIDRVEPFLAVYGQVPSALPAPAAR